MSAWRFVLLDSSGNQIAGLTAATARSVTWGTDAPSAATFTLSGGHPQAALILETATDLLVYDVNGIKRFRGRITSSSDDVSAAGHTCQFNAIDYRGFLQRRMVWPGSSFLFTGTEQVNIAWQLIADTQAQTGGNLGITNHSVATGINRNALYNYGDEILSTITTLADNTFGFEWEIDPDLRFKTYYPRRGGAFGQILAYGPQVISAKRTVDSSVFANAIRYSGDGSLVPATSVVGSFAGAGRWERQIGDTTIFDQATLNAKAVWYLAQNDVLNPSYEVVLNPAYAWDPSVAWIGDTITLVVRSGRLNVNGMYRISQIKVDPGDDGGDVVTLTCGPIIQTQTLRSVDIVKRLATLERR